MLLVAPELSCNVIAIVYICCCIIESMLKIFGIYVAARNHEEDAPQTIIHTMSLCCKYVSLLLFASKKVKMFF